MKITKCNCWFISIGIGIVSIAVVFAMWLLPGGMLGGQSGFKSTNAPIKISEVATTSTDAATDNFLTNGSFDEDPFDTGWTTSTPDGNATLTSTTTAASGSTTAVLCTISQDDSDGCVVSQVVSSTKSGLDYNVSFDARANADATIGTTTLRIFLSDELPTIEDGDFAGFTQCASLKAGTWTIVDATSTANEETEHCLIELEVGGSTPLTTSSYFSYDLDTLLSGALPSTFSSGKVSITLEMYGDTGDQVFLDNVNINEVEYTAYQDVHPNLFKYNGDPTALREQSAFCNIYFDYNDTCLYSSAYSSSTNQLFFSTLANTFDFSDKGINTVLETGDFAAEQPTQAEITAIFGDPDTLGDGFIGVAATTDFATSAIAVVIDGDWWIAGLKKATE